MVSHAELGEVRLGFAPPAELPTAGWWAEAAWGRARRLEHGGAPALWQD